MPLKLLLKFRISNPLKISFLKPKIIHGIFFSLLSEEVGDKFHSPALKPFSLFFPSYFKNSEKEIKTFSLEFNLLNLSLFPLISRELLLRRVKKNLNINGVNIKMISVKPLNSITYEEILENSKNKRDFIVDFLTPTAFKKGMFDYFLPEPVLVFKNLLKRWNAFSPKKIDYSLLEYVKKAVVLSGCWIKSQKVEISQHAKLTGFKGRVLFYSNEDSEENRLIESLLRFAEFSGIGRKTTMGFGKVKLC